MALQDTERKYESARKLQEFHTTHASLVSNELMQLRDKQNQLHLQEKQESERISQPLAREQSKGDTEHREYEKARQRFEQAQAEFKKAQEKFERGQTEFTKESTDVNRTLDSLHKKFEKERNRVETDIDRKQKELRIHQQNADNAGRDAALWMRRVEDERRSEMERMSRNTHTGQMSRNDVRNFSPTAANSNHAPDNRRYGT